MYVRFSQPMKTTGNLEKIHLTDEQGIKVEAIFNNVYELWNQDQTQLTLIFDPARVKTGLVANEQMGRALQEEKSYTLTIEQLEDVHHRKMESAFEKKFKASKADTIAPDIKGWKMNLPQSNTNSPFTINFPDLLDYNSLQTRIVLINEDSTVINGTIKVEEHERQWSFLPDKNWEKGTYFLLINARLEDPSGNNLNGLFDHKIGSLKYKREGVTQSLKFELK